MTIAEAIAWVGGLPVSALVAGLIVVGAATVVARLIYRTGAEIRAGDRRGA